MVYITLDGVYPLIKYKHSKNRRIKKYIDQLDIQNCLKEYNLSEKSLNYDFNDLIGSDFIEKLS